MSFEEAKKIFLNRGFVEVDGGTIFDGDKWREACVVISDFLEDLPVWISISERLPEEDGYYLVTLGNGEEVVAHTSGIVQNHDYEPKMLAWMPLPEPYKAEKV